MGKLLSADKMRIQTLREHWTRLRSEGDNGCIPTELLEAQYSEENL